MAITYQRISGGRLLLNVMTGGDDAEQRRFGDDLDKTARDRRAGEFITVFRQLWSGEPVTFHGDHLFVEDARIVLSGYPHLEEAFSFGRACCRFWPSAACSPTLSFAERSRETTRCRTSTPGH